MLDSGDEGSAMILPIASGSSVWPAEAQADFLLVRKTSGAHGSGSR